MNIFKLSAKDYLCNNFGFPNITECKGRSLSQKNKVVHMSLLLKQKTIKESIALLK